MYKSIIALFGAGIIFTGLNSCSSGYQPQNQAEVRIHELSDAESLNPVNYTDATAGYITGYLFYALLGTDFNTLQLAPMVAESRPEIEKIPEGGMLITYKIRPEAKWDDGTQITAKDAEFSLKVMKNPKVNNHHLKPYFEFISDVKLYEDDPLKLTVVCKSVYILAESSSGGFPLFSEKFYDPNGLMKDFTIKQLNEDAEKLGVNPKINEFATDFNSEKRAREKEFINGCGPYKLVEWTTGQRIVIEKKKDWWGEQFKGLNSHFDVKADKLIYQTINDQTTALVSLKAGNLDVMNNIKYKDFVELNESPKIKESFNLHTPPTLSYMYFGLNAKNPKFSDKNVRKALAHLVDIDKMIKTLCYGMGERCMGPIHPSKTKEFNPNIKPYEYDVEKAKQMLADAGWKDTNGDGTIDKTIDGEKTEFIIDFTSNAGNDVRKQAGLMFQEEARKVGIRVNVLQQDWSVYIDNQKKHNFEMAVGAWISAPVANDPKQIYHSESAMNGGSNYENFGTPECDILIDSIRIELDEDKRAGMYRRFQQIVYDEATHIFLWVPKERIAIHNRFDAKTSIFRPGYDPASFGLVQTATAN